MKIPLFKIFWDREDVKSADKVIKSGMNWCIGKEIEEFEKKIADYIGMKYCVTANSGGSALHALAAAYGFGPGDEIIVPSFTFIATAYTPLYVGAKPVFADIEEKSFGLDPDDVKRKITKNTKAIIPIHYGGIPCRIKELRKIADEHGLILIEDAAEAFGAKVDGKQVGTFGHSSIFSFCQNKIFSTSEGGCIVTNERGIYEKVKRIVSYGRISNGNYFDSNSNINYVEVGYNWRLSTILASLGLSQLNKVDKLVSNRRKNADYIGKRLAKIKQIRAMPSLKENFSVYQLYTIRVMDGSRNALMKFLGEKGISTKIYFDPVHKYDIFKKLGYSGIRLPVTEKVSSQVMSLPSYPHMKKAEMDYIVSSIAEFFRSK